MSTKKSYPDIHSHIQKLMGQIQREIPLVMEGFGKLHHAAVGDGTLDPKTKELIALGIAISVRCEGCISFHVHDALKAGATRPEIVEAIGGAQTGATSAYRRPDARAAGKVAGCSRVMSTQSRVGGPSEAHLGCRHRSILEGVLRALDVPR